MKPLGCFLEALVLGQPIRNQQGGMKEQFPVVARVRA
jgi:hypothetical protein